MVRRLRVLCDVFMVLKWKFRGQCWYWNEENTRTKFAIYFLTESRKLTKCSLSACQLLVSVGSHVNDPSHFNGFVVCFSNQSNLSTRSLQPIKRIFHLRFYAGRLLSIAFTLVRVHHSTSTSTPSFLPVSNLLFTGYNTNKWIKFIII